MLLCLVRVFVNLIALQTTRTASAWTSAQQQRLRPRSAIKHSESPEVADYQLRFGAVGRLYTSESISSLSVLEKLSQATVIVVGLGGVGSWAAESLCRSGIGHLVLIDLDDVCISNINRQVHALSSTVGKMKIDVLKDRLLQINPTCTVERIHEFVNKDNLPAVMDTIGRNVTYVLDAIDDSKDKAALLALCTQRKIPVVTCGAAAGLYDPSAITCQDLSAIAGDKLLAATRRELRKSFDFPQGLSFSQQQKLKRNVRKWRIVGVASTEPPKLVDEGLDNISSSLRRCDGALGTACFVTGTFGFVAASVIVEQIAKNQIRGPKVRMVRDAPTESAR